MNMQTSELIMSSPHYLKYNLYITILYYSVNFLPNATLIDMSLMIRIALVN